MSEYLPCVDLLLYYKLIPDINNIGKCNSKYIFCYYNKKISLDYFISKYSVKSYLFQNGFNSTTIFLVLDKTYSSFTLEDGTIPLTLTPIKYSKYVLGSVYASLAGFPGPIQYLPESEPLIKEGLKREFLKYFSETVVCKNVIDAYKTRFILGEKDYNDRRPLWYNTIWDDALSEVYLTLIKSEKDDLKHHIKGYKPEFIPILEDHIKSLVIADIHKNSPFLGKY